MSVSEFSRDLAALDKIRDANKRGKRFEQLVSEAFRDNHYTVESNNKTFVDGRECDLIATFRTRTLVVEAKWHRRPLEISVLDHLQIRLQSSPHGTVGCLVSRTRFSRQLIAKIRALRSPIVLFSIDEFIECVDTRSLHDAIETKISAFNSERNISPSNERNVSEQSTVRIVDGHDIHKSVYIETTTVPDLHFCWHWESNQETQLKLTPTIDELKYLSRAIRLAERDLEASSAGSFSIYGLDGSWHGLGSLNFLETLQDQSRRALVRHHSEDFRYTTEFLGGILQITGRHSNLESQHIDSTEIDISLEGIPLDLAPFQRLGNALGARRASFTTQEREDRLLSTRPKTRIKLDVLQLILSNDLRVDKDAYVIGLVAKNPVRSTSLNKRTRESLGLPDSDKIICDVKDHHPVSDAADYYYLVDVLPEYLLGRHALRIRATWNEMKNRAPMSFANSRAQKKSKRRIA